MDINTGAQQNPRYSSARFNEKGCLQGGDAITYTTFWTFVLFFVSQDQLSIKCLLGSWNNQVFKIWTFNMKLSWNVMAFNVQLCLAASPLKASPAVLTIWSSRVQFGWKKVKICRFRSGKLFCLAITLLLQALFAVDGTGAATLQTCCKECTKYELIAAQCFWLAHHND